MSCSRRLLAAISPRAPASRVRRCESSRPASAGSAATGRRSADGRGRAGCRQGRMSAPAPRRAANPARPPGHVAPGKRQAVEGQQAERATLLALAATARTNRPDRREIGGQARLRRSGVMKRHARSGSGPTSQLPSRSVSQTVPSADAHRRHAREQATPVEIDHDHAETLAVVGKYRRTDAQRGLGRLHDLPMLDIEVQPRNVDLTAPQRVDRSDVADGRCLSCSGPVPPR